MINAIKGEFETGFEMGGQTREHAILIRSLGLLGTHSLGCSWLLLLLLYLLLVRFVCVISYFVSIRGHKLSRDILYSKIININELIT